MSETARRALGEAVRSIREKAGMSQMELAFACDLHPTYVSRVETGARNPTWIVIVRLAYGLGIRPSELVGRAETLLQPDAPEPNGSR